MATFKIVESDVFAFSATTTSEVSAVGETTSIDDYHHHHHGQQHERGGGGGRVFGNSWYDKGTAIPLQDVLGGG